MEDLNYLINQLNIITKTIDTKIKENNKYVFFNECENLLDEYYSIVNTINNEIKNNCKHKKIIVHSNDDEIYYECDDCKQVL